MTRAKSDGLLLVVLGSLVFVIFGATLTTSSPGMMGDFRIQYYPARCLIHQCDPYNEAHVTQTYRAASGDQRNTPAESLQLITRYVYPPTAFALTAPFALLAFGPAHWAWMATSCASLIVAGLLIWDLGAASGPSLSGAMVGFLLANSVLIVTVGNVAGIVVGLAAIAVWCFIQERFVVIGAICLSISLLVKPHDTWLVWCYFLLAGKTYRKRSLQTLAAGAVLSLPAIFWVLHIAPHWIDELRSNLAYLSALGATDPNPMGMVIDLQAAVIPFRNDPHIYNLVSYTICGALLAVWSVLTLRMRPSLRTAILGLATIAPLTMLPFYHRQCDAKLLLLTIPASAMLWAEGNRMGRITTVLAAAGLLVTADIPWVIDIAALQHLKSFGWLLTALQLVPAPLILLCEAILFLWIYARQSESRYSDTVLAPAI